MPDGPPPYRQYAGLAFVILTYVGGIVGWSCAVQQVDSTAPPEAAAQVQALSVEDTPQATAAPAAVRLTSFRERRPSSGRVLNRFVSVLSPVPSHQPLTTSNGWADMDARAASVRR